MTNLATSQGGQINNTSSQRFGLNFKKLADSAYHSGFWLVCLTYLAVFMPTYSALAAGPWSTDQDSHGVLIHIIVLFQLLLSMEDIQAMPRKPAYFVGGLFLLAAAFFLALGQSQSQLLFASGAQLPTLIGLALVFRGWACLWKIWFPITFLSFGVPMPGWLLDAFTQNAKLEIAYFATEHLYALGYPMAQNGVTMMIGQFQLLVKDACAGLNSLYGLLAVGLIYIYATRNIGLIRNSILFLLIVPAAIIANYLRVIILALVTYHFGEAAGQGFLHDIAGFVMFILALLVFLATDSLLLMIHRAWRMGTGLKEDLGHA